MIVCVCRRVSDRDIERVARSGCTSFDELQMELGVATCCGQCADCARQKLASTLRHEPAASHLPLAAELALA
ncbi:(2Fe-2S)-binding protein [Caldimonas thermodepolymerans]|jgi:bacterioferritin-associated ferredoxin|uniref:Bacterioferritin-associated ferredoxin n=1 Tax=Caldimonas thermodepolymerans TaxID=215580 RepID=A0A2S5T7C3_9BURK|nr:(2Fe-2S)-binding protein [Caldimonas thermodepolymerans]PPE70832.1 (2Fe-2S)-binding protein [Caldimonas thermodepolymerans]QPC33051.1 (2Fe-2S)-binding protein [Caldimonas thermodepolymerans]RDI03838.1 bacterioferritin-associated ferredoxin [Caldimonas thermodepolymerans]TCP09805.1 bacterioferritin-associated ferredoxin [Caldimonas thermodepolymerans]UZG45920.1 (2Fe-2S)-binding protein [Caldimonas thermodepolymerans]